MLALPVNFCGQTYQSEKNTLDDDSPAISEVSELVGFHPAGLCKTFDCRFGQSNQNGSNDQYADEEDETSHEDIRLLNMCSETYSVNTSNNDVLQIGTARAATAAARCVSFRGVHVGDSAQQSIHRSLNRALSFLNLNRDGAQSRQIGSRSASGGSLIPGGKTLQEANSNNAHTPLEVLSPGLHDWRHSDRGHADDGLSLENTK